MLSETPGFRAWGFDPTCKVQRFSIEHSASQQPVASSKQPAPRILKPIISANSNAARKKYQYKECSLIADLESRTIPGTGHFVPMQKPNECSEIIKEFVNRKNIMNNLHLMKLIVFFIDISKVSCDV
jgi:hypothetical protein